MNVDMNEEHDEVVTPRQWPVTVTLKHPIEFGNEQITKLTFRRGRIGDLKGVKLDGVPTVDQILLIASRMCGQMAAALALLDAEDAGEVLEVTLGFFGQCLANTSRG